MEDWEKFEVYPPKSDAQSSDEALGNNPQNYQQSLNAADYQQNFAYGEQVNTDSNTIYYNYDNYDGYDGYGVKPKKTPKYVTRKAFVLTLIICMLFSSFMGAGVFAALLKFTNTSIPLNKTISTTNYSLVSATGSELSIQEIVLKNQNSVVAIETEKVSRDSWLGQYVTQGAGSGVVYTSDGYVITNNHVIEGATNIKVILRDGTEYDAELIATDSQTDVAVLKVNATGLTPVTVGNMEQLSVGSIAVAIGNPLGSLPGTPSEGIISSLERDITLSGKPMTVIQTTAPVNPGNSGGGLFDQYGNLIGIVVAKSSGSDIEGLGFAIPITKVEEIAQALISKGYVEGRPAAGITIVDLTSQQEAIKNGVSMPGVYISDVNGENAKKAGFKVGDMVYYFEDVKITKGSSQLISEIRKKNVGDKVTFTIIRENDLIKITTVLEDASKIPPSNKTTITDGGND